MLKDRHPPKQSTNAVGGNGASGSTSGRQLRLRAATVAHGLEQPLRYGMAPQAHESRVVFVCAHSKNERGECV